jgi:hypothetical protein
VFECLRGRKRSKFSVSSFTGSDAPRVLDSSMSSAQQFTVTVIERCVLSHVGGVAGAYYISLYYSYGGLGCIVNPCFCAGGVIWVEASTKVACADRCRNWPLLIVHGSSSSSS